MDGKGKQQEILDFIERALDAQGYPPTVREIGAAVGLSSTASVQAHLSALEARGDIRRGSSKRRALELVRRNSGAARSGEVASPMVPLVGRVAAGAPVLAEQNIEELLQIPSFMGADEQCFALHVKGTSMVNAGILDGDLVVVRQQHSAEDGDIVVAMLDDEATVKRLFREAGRVRLQPENDDMQPIYASDPVVLGKVIGVIRRV